MRIAMCAVLAAAMAACTSTPAAKASRQQLAERGIPFSGDALLSRVLAGDAAAVDMFVKAGIDVNAPDADHRWTPLMLGAFAGHADVVSALLAANANPAAVNEHGTTALMFAAIRGQARAAKVLADKGAPLDARDAGGHTALMFAANNGHADTVRTLIEAGADRSLRNINGHDALAYAKTNGHADVTQLLQSTGAASR